MKRRTILKSTLALPLVNPVARPEATILPSSAATSAIDRLFTGLPGLDYAMGGIAPGELIALAGPPCASKTLLLLDAAARFVRRYATNVVFFSAHKPSVYIAKKLALKDEVPVFFASDRWLRPGADIHTPDRPGIYLLDCNLADTAAAFDLGNQLRQHPAGCAAVILDGWSIRSDPALEYAVIDGIPHYPAERWPRAPLSESQLNSWRLSARTAKIPVILGVTTPSWNDEEALAASLHTQSRLKAVADRFISLYRPDFYLETQQVTAETRDAVRLTGTSPFWWDTRCSKLRFEARQLSFVTVA